MPQLRRKDELLKVLEHPDIPLHTNAWENDIRSFVTRRKISGGTISLGCRIARDVMLGQMKTRQNLGTFSYRYLGGDAMRKALLWFGADNMIALPAKPAIATLQNV